MSHRTKAAPVGRSWTKILLVVERLAPVTVGATAEALAAQSLGQWSASNVSRQLHRMTAQELVVVVSGHLWGVGSGGRSALARMRAQRTYRTDIVHRIKSKHRRDRLRESKLCINGAGHGKATHGCRCADCHATHKETA